MCFYEIILSNFAMLRYGDSEIMSLHNCFQNVIFAGINLTAF